MEKLHYWPETIHYTKDNLPESIEIIEALGCGEGFLMGNCLKYLYRAGQKEGESKQKDLTKALSYLERLVIMGENEKTT